MNALETFEEILLEATRQVEEELALEDKGWDNLSKGGGEVVSATDRVENLTKSRTYAAYDPLARQAVRLWVDYTLGSGMTFQSQETRVMKALNAYWGAVENQGCLSAMGQRRSASMQLIDGEIFFCLFLGGAKTTVRRIDPLEITEIVCDPDDKEKVMYYKRESTDTQRKPHTSYYRSLANYKGLPCLDKDGTSISKDSDNVEKAAVYHFPFTPTDQRGNPLLLPCLDWLKLHRRFMASRVAITIARARFAWKIKQAGGQAEVDATKAKIDDEQIKAGSTQIENMAQTLTPLPQDTGAGNAYQDGRMLKLLIASAVGIPEQYFGDISIGNLATAKTVELPMMKMFTSYQTTWGDAYDQMDRLVLAERNITGEFKVDRDFPKIAPEDQTEMASAISLMVSAFPQFAYSRDVQTAGLYSVGVDDTARVLDELDKDPRNKEAKLHQAVNEYTHELRVALKEIKDWKSYRKGIEEGEGDGLSEVPEEGVY